MRLNEWPSLVKMRGSWLARCKKCLENHAIREDPTTSIEEKELAVEQNRVHQRRQLTERRFGTARYQAAARPENSAVHITLDHAQARRVINRFPISNDMELHNGLELHPGELDFSCEK